MIKDMTVGKPYRLIFSFCIPLMFGNLFQQMYNMVDTIIVGRFLGKEALAAVGSTGAVNFLILGFVNGLCCGFSIPVAQSFGAKDYSAMRRCVANMVWASLILGGIITLVTGIWTREILILMQTPSNILEDAYAYIFTIFLGTYVTILYNCLAGIMRALGDSKTPLLFLACASLLNVVLDLFFIIVMNTGVFGAALATVISQGISGLLCLVFLIKKFPILHIQKEEWKWDGFSVKRLFNMGLPMGLQYSITAIGSTVLQTAVNSLGSDIVASITAANKVQMLVTQPMETLGVTMATYCGQNLGARRFDRIRQGVWHGSLLGIFFSIVALIIVICFGSYISLLFVESTETQLITNIQQFLLYNGLCYILLTLLLVFRNTLQGMGHAALAMSAGVMEMIARSIVAFCLVGPFGYTAVCCSNPIAWTFALFFLIPAYFVLRRRMPA